MQIKLFALGLAALLALSACVPMAEQAGTEAGEAASDSGGGNGSSGPGAGSSGGSSGGFGY